MTIIKKQLIEEYEINTNTMIVSPVQYGSKIYSKILEQEDEYISPFKPTDIIKKSCSYFGSSYEGRKQGTRNLIGITHKVPVAIDPTNFIYFFPTTSPNNSQCAWISLEHVLDHERLDPYSTLVTFINKQTLELPISANSFKNQLLRTALLRTKLMQRLDRNDRKWTYGPRQGERQVRALESSSTYWDTIQGM